MKFGKYFIENQDIEWSKYYINYKFLKQCIKVENSSRFKETLKHNIDKLNWFFNNIGNKYNLENTSKVQKFLVLNYMAIFKAIKKHDKKLAKNMKIEFFQWIRQEPFYNYYLNLPRIKNNVQLVIFDKDGTLISLHKIFGKWIEKLAVNFSEIYLDKLQFFESLGYDEKKKTFEGNSIVAKGTNDDIRNCIYKNLQENNDITNDIESLKYIVKDKWIDIDLDFNDLETCGNILKIFNYLRKKNIKIAVCTSDDRLPTIETLKYLNISHFLENVICGDDYISNKPSPEPLWKISNNLDIDVSNCVMIGDTISDIHAGINAKFGHVIGVLSGGYENNELSDADHIIDNIDNLIDLFEKNILY